MTGEAPIYADRQLTVEDKRVIDKLTESPNWDFKNFNQVMVALAAKGEYIPAYHAPQSIHIQDFGPKLDRLAKHSKELGLETGQPFFVDTETGKFIYGKITKGTLEGSQHSIRIDRTTQAGREKFQKRVLTAHVHPEEGGFAFGIGFSDMDHINFLEDKERIGQIIKVGDTVFMALKTSVTPNNMDREAIEKRIDKIHQETMDKSTKSDIQRLIDLNKQICTEFGMVLYMATKQSRDLMERVPVAVAT